MSHEDKIKDTDAFFVVDPITRQIKNMTPSKIVLVQGDHNSEIFSFSLPRFIEGHDMAESTKANLHYINPSKSVVGMYEMKDLRVDPDDSEKVICSWVISGNATKEAGAIFFFIEFVCYEGNVLVYRWKTLQHKGISIGESFDNAEEIAEMYADVLQQWHDDLFGSNVNPDYNQNDETKPDYIKNRPFFESRILLGQPSELPTDPESPPDVHISFEELSVGDTVIVEVEKNGEIVSVEDTIIDADGYVGGEKTIHNPSLFDSVNGCGVRVYVNSVMVINSADRTSGIVRVYKKVLKQLDEKFIPDTIARTSDLHEPLAYKKKTCLVNKNLSEGESCDDGTLLFNLFLDMPLQQGDVLTISILGGDSEETIDEVQATVDDSLSLYNAEDDSTMISMWDDSACVYSDEIYKNIIHFLPPACTEELSDFRFTIYKTIVKKIDKEFLPENDFSEILSKAQGAYEKAATASYVAQMAIENGNRNTHRLESVESIAKGAARAQVYKTYKEMAEAFATMTADDVRVGDHIYIEQLNVPDLWVSKVHTTELEGYYDYTTDEMLVLTLSSSGSLPVNTPWFEVSMLETQKVNLSACESVDNRVMVPDEFSGDNTSDSERLYPSMRVMHHEINKAIEEKVGTVNAELESILAGGVD